MLRSFLLEIFIVSALTACQAQSPAAPDATAASARAAVEATLASYEKTFNSHDAQALAAAWTPDGVYVDKTDGGKTASHDALLADFQALFAKAPKIQLTSTIEAIRIVGGTVALVDGATTVVVPDEDPDVSTFSAVLVNTGGKWLLDTVHEIDAPAPPTSHDALASLDWMVGHWRDATEGVSVDTTIRWSPSQAFLVRSYKVDREGEDPFEGTQVIGWDPAAKQIRSWTFHSDGSFGEGRWSASGDEWLVRTTQTLADGRSASATQVIKRVDEDTATVQTIGKEIDGEPAPATEPVTMVRVKEEDTKDATSPPSMSPSVRGPAPGAAPVGASR